MNKELKARVEYNPATGMTRISTEAIELPVPVDPNTGFHKDRIKIPALFAEVRLSGKGPTLEEISQSPTKHPIHAMEIAGSWLAINKLKAVPINGPPPGITPKEVESVIAEVEKELFNLGCSAEYALIRVRDKIKSRLFTESAEFTKR